MKKSTIILIISALVIAVLIGFLLLVLDYTNNIDEATDGFKNNISYYEMTEKMNNGESFNVLIYDSKLEESDLKIINKEYNNLYIINIAESSDYKEWLETEDGKKALTSYSRENCTSACGNSIDKFVNKYLYDNYDIGNIEDEHDYFQSCLTVVTKTPEECKKYFEEDAGLLIYKGIFYSILGFNEDNTIYEITNGVISKKISYKIEIIKES